RLRRLDLRAGADPRAASEAAALCRRSAVPDQRVRDVARAIVDEVREGGAPAVRAINGRVGGGRPDGRLLLDRTELTRALHDLPADLRGALEASIDNV